MELREKAGSEDMLTVEKRLERQKAKAEHRLRQMASASERQVSVFDFINSKLTKNTTDDSKGTDISRNSTLLVLVQYTYPPINFRHHLNILQARVLPIRDERWSKQNSVDLVVKS